MDAIQLVLAAVLCAAAVYLGLKGLVRVMRNTGEIRNHLFKAKRFSVAAVLVAVEIGLYAGSWAIWIIVPILLAGTWLEYWIARAQFRELNARWKPDE